MALTLVILTLALFSLSSYVAYCDFKEDINKHSYTIKTFIVLLIPFISILLGILQAIDAKRVEKNISPWVLSENEKQTIKTVLSQHKTFDVDMYYAPGQSSIYQEMVKLLSEAGWTVNKGNGPGRPPFLVGGGSGPPIEFNFNTKDSKATPEPILVLKEAFGKAGLLDPNNEGVDYSINQNYDGKNVSLSFLSKPYLPL